MKPLFSMLLLSVLTAGATAVADPIPVRIQTVDKKIHIGEILERAEGSVVFRAQGASSSVLIADGRIAYIRFPLKDSKEDLAKQLYDEGKYAQCAVMLDEISAPYMEYVSLPSNLSLKVMRRMNAAYWLGEYDLVQTLSEVLRLFPQEEVKNSCLYFGGLVRLEQGNAKWMEAFLKTPKAAVIYPAGSPSEIYIQSRFLQAQGKYIQAIRSTARMMARFSRDADWMPKAELLCAELYFQLEMPESARSVLADIEEFYSNPQIKKKAAALAARN